MSLAQLAAAFRERAEELGLPEGELAYAAEPPTAEDLEARTDRDLERGTTGLGPHLDDVGVLAAGRDLRAFGSQGEQRLAVLALLLGEAELLAERRGVPPLLLLDDVLSELDPTRRRILADRLRVCGTGTRHERKQERAARRSCPDDRGHPGPGRRQQGGGRVMEKIGKTVRRELGRFGTAGAMTDLVAAWPGVVGEQVAANAWPARFARDGTLLVSTSSSAWAFELGHLESEILPRLQQALAEPARPAQVRSGAVARALAGCLRGPEDASRRAHPGAGA